MTAASDCAGGACTCGGGGGGLRPAVASVNGLALHEPGERVDESRLRERAWAELLRQEAVRQRLLPRHPLLEAPPLSAGDREVIEQMLERTVTAAQPNDDECRRFYDARKSHYIEGRQVHARHILFAVTPGVDVHKLAIRAEQALLELMHKDVPPSRFVERARELSNCPSGADGGDLGWLAPEECVDELANELFQKAEPLDAIGLRPRLVHSRFGFHILEVLGRKPGRQQPYEEVRERVAVQLSQQSRVRALRQYVQLLAGQARVEGVRLESAVTPLVQ